MTEIAYRTWNGLSASLPWSRRRTRPATTSFPGDRNAESFVPHGRRNRAIDVFGFPEDYRIRRVA
jgi:hypothetical protein